MMYHMTGEPNESVKCCTMIISDFRELLIIASKSRRGYGGGMGIIDMFIYYPGFSLLSWTLFPQLEGGRVDTMY